MVRLRSLSINIHVFKVFHAGKISFDKALENADGANNLRLKIELTEKSDNGGSSDNHGGLSLLADESDEEAEENGMAYF